MNKTTRRFDIALAAAAGLACAAPAAFAAGTFTVTAGSAPPGTAVSFTGASTGPTPQFRLTDTTSSAAFTCASSSVPGNTTVGSGLSGVGIASINGSGMSWQSPCTGAGSNLLLSASGTWFFNATSGDSAGVSGTLTNINLVVNGSSCSFTASGSAPATYTNATETLGINGGGLTISNVGGTCGILGTFRNGDAATLQVDYALPGTNPVAITSP